MLVDTTRSQANLLQSFLDLIGSVNAGYLSHICINFPVVVTDSESAVGNRRGGRILQVYSRRRIYVG